MGCLFGRQRATEVPIPFNFKGSHMGLEAPDLVKKSLKATTGMRS